MWLIDWRALCRMSLPANIWILDRPFYSTSIFSDTFFYHSTATLSFKICISIEKLGEMRNSVSYIYGWDGQTRLDIFSKGIILYCRNG